ncbi:MAG: hypothetical protein V1913_07935 [Fibrobacterota bacterium]
MSLKSILLLAVAATALHAAAPGFVPAMRKLAVLPDSSFVTITEQPLERGSVQVERKGRILVRESDYRVDYEARRLELLYLRQGIDTLTVRFCESAFGFPSLLSRRRMEETPVTGSDSVNAPAAAAKASWALPAEENTTLSIGGVKTVGVTMGSGNGFAIDQSLNLTLQGEIARDIALRAVLTDQNMPFQPEGNTESVRELDRVLVEIESPHTKGALGDLQLAETESRFAGFTRKVKGLQAEAHNGSNRVFAAAAMAEGLFHTLTLQGEEQKQGPYRLVSREGRPGIVVLAGTERIFVDGRLRKRGQSQDYVIDYGNGQITFTQNCLITADNPITAEYEYSEMDFPKSLAAAEGRAAFGGGRLELAGSVFHEADDPAHPLRMPLSAGDRELLKEAGDSTRVPGSGVRPLSRDSVNAYRGFYLYIPEPGLPDSHYVYKTPRDTALFPRGPYYSVEFLVRGAGQGSYRPDTIADSTDPALSGTYAARRTIYVYAGPGLGSYEPGRELPLPGSLTLGHVQYRFRDADGLLTVRGELAGSRYDRNTLSNRGDNDNLGGASLQEASLAFGRFLGEGGPGRFTLTGRNETVQARFTPAASLQNTFTFSQVWALSGPGGLSDAHNLTEGGLEYAPVKSIRATADAGYLLRESDRAHRGSARLTVSPAAGRRVTLSQEYARADTGRETRTLLRTNTRAEWRILKLTPSAAYTGESRNAEAGGLRMRQSRYREYMAGLSTNVWGALSTESGATARLDEKNAAGAPETLMDSARALTLRNRVIVTGPGGLRAEAALTNRRSQRLEQTRWNRYNSDLMDLRADAALLEGAVEPGLRYSLAAEHSQSGVDRYEAVPPGLGTHVRDPLTGDYVPKEGGDYRFAGTLADTSLSARNVNAVELAFRLSVAPGRLARLRDSKGAARDLFFDTDLLVTQDKYPEGYDRAGRPPLFRYLPDFLPGRVDGTLCSRYALSLKQDLALDMKSRDAYLRLRLFPRYRFDFRPLGTTGSEADKWQGLLYSLLLRHRPFTPRSLEHEATAEWVRRSKASALFDYDVLNRSVSADASLELTRRLSLPLLLAAGVSEDRAETHPLRVVYYRVKPGLLFMLAERGRAEARYEFVRVRTDERTLLYEMAEGNKPGTNHRVTLSSQFSAGKNADFDFSYTWEKEGNAPKAVQRGSAQLKAYF